MSEAKKRVKNSDKGTVKVSSKKAKSDSRLDKKARVEKMNKSQDGHADLKKMMFTVLGIWVAIGCAVAGLNHSQGTLMPDWVNMLTNPGEVVTETMEPGDGENMPVLGDKVSIEYTASVAATGRAFDTTQGRGPMTFEVGQEPPKVLLGLDVGVRNMTLGETAEMKISSNFAFGSRSVGEGENIVPPGSDVVFVVKLVAINELLAPEPEEEEEEFEDNWDDLSEEETEAATKLGWSEDTWGQHTELTQTPWDELSEEDVEAAEVLGYDQETWEDPEEFTDPDAEGEEEGDEGGDED